MDSSSLPPPLPPAPPPVPKGRKPASVLWKMGMIGILVLLLLIPLGMIRATLSERLQRRDQAIREITSTWGDEQTVVGPVLIVPYKYSFKTWKQQVVDGRSERVETVETAVAQAFFLPSELEVDGELDPDVLHRGIYQAVVYRSQLKLSGAFRVPAFDEWKVKPQDVLWEDAVVAFGVSDLRGAKNALTIRWGDADLPLVPGRRIADLTGVESRLKLAGPPQDVTRFQIELSIQGSQGIRFAPVGEMSKIRLASRWPDPSFQGAFLPTDRQVTPAGFDATWNVSYYGRGYPQQWTDRDSGPAFNGVSIASSGFGVDLISLLDVYRFVERAIKYGILFIVLVFTAFFLFETLARIRVHPFQYTLIGVALCLFYLALLSLSEFVSFGAAYLLGAAVSTVMISGYSRAALRSGKRSALLGIGLAVTYGFLYVLLRLQDYSLLLGTAGLFLVLGIVMFVTRRIDWYARET